VLKGGGPVGVADHVLKQIVPGGKKWIVCSWMKFFILHDRCSCALGYARIIFNKEPEQVERTVIFLACSVKSMLTSRFESDRCRLLI